MIINSKEFSASDEWQPVIKIKELNTWQLKACEVLFDNQEICDYWDDWPFAIVTHFRLIKKAPVKGPSF
jgi:hypothetical protein